MVITDEVAKEFSKTFNQIALTVSKVFVGKMRIVQLVLASLLANQHILLEDVPGTGKTVLAKTVALTISGSAKRIQFTPDLLPSDITGISIYNQQVKQFVFHEGPVFANIVLADEINRASSKTQSALLEVMQEYTVTVDNLTKPVPQPFIVIATQNPVEQVGTYQLPEAELDRFGIKLSIGYLDQVDALQLLESSATTPQIQPVVDVNDILRLQSTVKEVHCAPKILKYILDLTEATRNQAQIQLGVSQRGASALHAICKAYALCQGRSYVIPDDVQELLLPVFAHRILVEPEAQFEGVTATMLLNELLLQIDVPF